MSEGDLSDVCPERRECFREVGIAVVPADDVPEFTDGIVYGREVGERVHPGTEDEWRAENGQVERRAPFRGAGVSGITWIAGRI